MIILAIKDLLLTEIFWNKIEIKYIKLENLLIISIKTKLIKNKLKNSLQKKGFNF